MKNQSESQISKSEQQPSFTLSNEDIIVKRFCYNNSASAGTVGHKLVMDSKSEGDQGGD
jgi:hypothetical protein